MARTKKDGEKSSAGATIQIDVDSFIRLRDSVVTGLATLQNAIQTISSEYIKHTSAVLGEHGSTEISSALADLANNPLLQAGGLNSLRAASPPKSPVGDLKKEKKKRVHDPNAPKRPLTPYFLYMQTARPIIAQDLGPEVAKGAVSTEGVRRWNMMIASDKLLWHNAYNDNLRLYNARMHSYKAGNLNAKDITDEDALLYADTHNIPVPDAGVDGQLAAEASLDAPGEIDDTIPELPKSTPKAAKAPRNRKSGAKEVTAPPAAIVPPPAIPVVEKGSPDKKRKRASGKKADEAVESVEAPAEKKSRKKKSKGEA